MPSRTRPSVEFDSSSHRTNADIQGGSTLPAPRITWRFAAGLLMWLAVGLMAIPLAGAVPVFGSSAAHMPLAPVAPLHIVTGPSHSALSALAAADRALPGTDSTHLLPISNPANIDPTHMRPGDFAMLQRERARAEYNASHRAAPAATHAGITIPTGTFTGWVYWTPTRKPIGGVTVQAFSQGSAICPITTCNSTTTGSNGYFSVPCPVGDDFLTYTAGWNVTNKSFAYCTNGITTSVGVIYLVPTGFGHVLVLGDVPGHPGIPGVSITCAARDASFTGIPEVFTFSNGSAIFPALPFPAKCTFVPPPGWQENFTWTNATPLENICVGQAPKCILYLEPEVRVRAQLYDAITHNAIGALAAFRVCPIGDGSCILQGNTVSGPTVESFGPIGPDIAVFDALGYVVNKTFIGNVPKLAPPNVYTVPGDPAHPGRIYLVPEGGFRGYVNLSANKTPPWGTGLYTASVCGMNGYKVVQAVMGPFGGINLTEVDCDLSGSCNPVGVQVTFFGPPMRTNLIVAPDTGGACGFFPTWPIPGLTPVWPNETWVNITPGAILQHPISVNLTVGSYVYGNMYRAGTTLGLNGTPCVAITSTDNGGLANYPYCYNPIQPPPFNCPQTSTFRQSSNTFCAPAPPGPFQIRVSDSPLYNTNWTWGYHQPLCCNTSAWEQPLSVATLNRYQSINLSINSGVNGTVYINGTKVPVFFATVTVCSASSNPLYVCSGTVANTTGAFLTTGPPGWDFVSVSASGYAPNTAWVNVSGNRTASVGTIYMTPLAHVTGRVLDPTGLGLYDASVHYCQAVSPAGCFIGAGTNLGSGSTSTDGTYNGTLLGGWLPWTSYVISISAPGYSTDWTWFNATPGAYVTIPTITLQAVGTNQSAGGLARGHAAATPVRGSTIPASGVWVDGRIVDNLTQWGVSTGGISACSYQFNVCTPFADGSNTGGYFNWSVIPGLYNLTVSASDYYPTSIFFNASAAGTVHFSTIQLRPYNWVHGRASIWPWATLKIPTWIKTSTASLILGPGAAAKSCDESLSICGLSEPIDSAGFFTVATPGGNFNRVDVLPTFTGGDTSAAGGFVRNMTSFNSTNVTTNLTGAAANANTSSMIPLEVFAAVSFYVRDNSTYIASKGYERLPVREAAVSITTVGTHNGGVAWSTDMGGHVTFFLPGGNANNSTAYRGFLPLSFLPQLAYLPIVIHSGDVVVAKNLSLVHFGWSQFVVRNPATHLGVSYISVQGIPLGPMAPSGVGNGQANLAGQVNITAPPYRTVNFTIGPAADYNSTNFTLWINTSATTLFNSSDIGHLGYADVPPWGWARSDMVNYTGSPLLTTVYDKVAGLPIPLVSVGASSGGGAYSGTGGQTNWAGQFLVDAPIGRQTQLFFQKSAFLTNQTTIGVHPGQEVALRTVNLTAMGVIAGRVVSNPGTVPVAGATVSVCPVGGRVCQTIVTNRTGLWWAVTSPGVAQVTVSADGYVPNTGVGRSASDTYTWMGQITVDQYAYVSGFVRGLPSGIPLGNASVAACSPFGTPVGPCGFAVNTTPLGSFLLPVPAGSYVLQASANLYNSSYLPLALTPGEHVYVGTRFLDAYGYLQGVVYSGSTFSPIFNASVYACPVWSGQGCSQTVYTDTAGRYTAFGPPGQYAVTVTAPGYHDATIFEKIGSGNVSAAPTVYLYPIGTSAAFPVTGRVLDADTTHPIVGATVAGLVNGTAEFSTATNSLGAFSLPLVWGQYNLTAYAAGYHPQTRVITVNGPVSNQVFALTTMTYVVSGIAADALTHTPVPGVVISENGVPLATTDTNGLYSVQLTNGSHDLVATPPVFGGVSYAVVPFIVTVNGVDQHYAIALLPPSAALYGTVADALTALPIANATVRLAGTTIDGIPLVVNLQSNAVGEFTLNVPQGTYSVAASSAGYASKVVKVEASNSAAQVTIALTPYSTTSSGAGSPWMGTGGLWLLAAVVIGLVGATFLVGFFAGRSRRTTTIAPRRPPPGATGGGGRAQ